MFYVVAILILDYNKNEFCEPQLRDSQTHYDGGDINSQAFASE